MPTLQALLDSEHEVVAVYTQPDRRKGRGQQVSASPVKLLAETKNLPIVQPASLRDDAVQAALAAWQADVMVVVAYGLILPEAVLALPRYGCINVHGSLLPRWRGAAPIQRAIEAGDETTGVTIMQMDKGLDTGSMLKTVTCPIDSQVTSSALAEQLAQLGAGALVSVLDEIEYYQAAAQTQDDALASYAKKMTKAESELSWQLPAMTIYNTLRAFDPWPGISLPFDGKRLKVWRAEVVADATTVAPGEVVATHKDALDIATGQGVLRLLEVQLPNAKRISVRDFLNGLA